MQIFPIASFTDNYIWAITQHNKVIVVDPGESLPVVRFLQDHKLTLAAILVTHHHFDHTGGIPDLLQQYQVPVYGPKQGNTATVSHHVTEPDQINIEQLCFQIANIPGHTLDHIAYIEKQQKMLFCGDTLFSAGCGKFFEGTPTQMFNSLHKLTSLASDTKVYCAHEYTAQNLKFALHIEPSNQDIQQQIAHIDALHTKNQPSLPTTIANELRINPFLRTNQPSVINAVEDATGKSNLTTIEVLAALRNLKDNF